MVTTSLGATPQWNKIECTRMPTSIASCDCAINLDWGHFSNQLFWRFGIGCLRYANTAMTISDSDLGQDE